MDANKILSSSLLDIVFDTRNKNYGAYELRKSYSKRIVTALSITGTLVLLILFGSSFANGKQDDLEATKVKTVVIENYVDEPKPPVTPPEPPPAAPPVQTIQHTTIKLVPPDEVIEPPATQDEMKTARIDVATNPGVEDDHFVGPTEPAVGEGKGIIEPPKPKEETIAEFVEIQASFPGGIDKWRKFLERNLSGQVPSDNGAASGRYTVVIRFVVDEDGTVSNLQPMTKLGYGMEEEALRVLKKATSMKWTPGFQNGRYVKSYRSQPITFEVQE